jgi:predicted nucleotidyltransferase
MEKWEVALNKFVKKWEKRDDVVGLLVCGSYVTGNPTSHSDVDIQIILDRSVDWRERGNEYIDGILFEYFANSLLQNIKYFEDDYKLRRKVNVHMFKTGKVIFDKNGDLQKLIDLADVWDKKEFPDKNHVSLELSKYHLWDMKDNLEEVYDRNGDEFYIVYFVHLDKMFDIYASYLKYYKVPVYKLKRFLTNEEDRKKYRVVEFPDKRFVELYTDAITLQEKKEMMFKYSQLTEYVLDKMGGFNISDWRVRSSSEN